MNPSPTPELAQESDDVKIDVDEKSVRSGKLDGLIGHSRGGHLSYTALNVPPPRFMTEENFGAMKPRLL